jgi:anti-sigma28 factor (negative regulator of flagellin synthesis)
MKIGQPSSLVTPGISGGSPPAKPARTQPGAESAPQTELSLTAASQAVFAGRPERVAELKRVVESGSYAPQTLQVSEKMVNEALSRPE